MAISDKTRKTLWARSGNRCAMCRAELVAERDEHSKNLNIGDECHIISERPNGPRFILSFGNDHDDYENLILLCKNHHRTVDELWETYTDDLLHTIKANHEKWIRTVIDNANKKEKSNAPKLLPRLFTGKQVVDIIVGVHAYQFDHDEFRSSEEAEVISGFLQEINDWGEISGFGDFEIGQKAQLGFDLNKRIEEVEKLGFLLFGERKTSKMTDGNKTDLGIWQIALIVVLRQNNPAIISSQKFAATSDSGIS